MSKVCRVCSLEKPLSEFSKQAASKDGYQRLCKACAKVESQAYHEAAREDRLRKMAAYQQKNAEALKEYRRQRYVANREQMKAASSAQYAADPERCKARVAAYQAANPDAVRARHLAYYNANRDRIKAALAAWQEKNRDHVRAKGREYRKANRDKVRVWLNRAHAKRKAAPGTFTPEDVRTLMKLQRGLCIACRCDIRVRFHVDHIIPLAKGGTNWPSNLQLLCPPCNHRKSAKHPVDFMRERGFLL